MAKGILMYVFVLIGKLFGSLTSFLKWHGKEVVSGKIGELTQRETKHESEERRYSISLNTSCGLKYSEYFDKVPANSPLRTGEIVEVYYNPKNNQCCDKKEVGVRPILFYLGCIILGLIMVVGCIFLIGLLNAASNSRGGDTITVIIFFCIIIISLGFFIKRWISKSKEDTAKLYDTYSPSPSASSAFSSKEEAEHVHNAIANGSTFDNALAEYRRSHATPFSPASTGTRTEAEALQTNNQLTSMSNTTGQKITPDQNKTVYVCRICNTSSPFQQKVCPYCRAVDTMIPKTVDDFFGHDETSIPDNNARDMITLPNLNNTDSVLSASGVSASSPVYNTKTKPLFCRQCGTRLIEGSAFCKECGTPIYTPKMTVDNNNNGFSLSDTELSKGKEESVVVKEEERVEENCSHIVAPSSSPVEAQNSIAKPMILECEGKKEPTGLPPFEIDYHDNDLPPKIKRAFLFIEDGEWDRADAYLEDVLDEDPTSAYAYLGKLMIDLKLKSTADLNNYASVLGENRYYQKAVRFADDNLSQILMAIKKV